MAETASLGSGAKWVRRTLPDALGVAWMVVIGVALLLPALVHGSHIGSYDLLSRHGLSTQLRVVPHNYVNNDQIDEMIPWSDLVWTQVHQGHLPLWNPYNGLGLPLAFNWQSAPLALSALVGYLVPLQYAFDVGMIVTLVVAGTGVFFLARVLNLGVLAGAFAGTVFELSGPLTGWLGFPHAGVMSWAGWLFAAAILVLRREHRMRSIVLFAFVVAMTVYSGQPEVLLVFGLALVVFVVVLIVQRLPWFRGSGPIIRPTIDLVIAAVAGLALAAPLALPGLQAISGSSRNGSAGEGALQLHDFIYFISQGFDGLPIVGSWPFGASFFYEESAAYVGIIAVALAALAISVRYRRPEVIGFSVVTALMVVLIFVPPVTSTLNSLPILGKVSWDRALMPAVLGAAILSGFGLDALVRSHTDRVVRRRGAVSFGVAAACLLVIFVFGRGDLPAVLARYRTSSFIGPALGVAAGLVVIGVLALADNRGKQHFRGPVWIGCLAGMTLLLFETGFLLTSGAPVLSSSSTFLKLTPAEQTLKKTVGSSVVGFGDASCGSLGIDVSDNDAFGVHEFDAYDPIIPANYYSSWDSYTGTTTGFSVFNEFCPVVRNAAEARLFGVSYVLEKGGSAGPQGGVFVRTIDGEALFRIPHSGIATVTPLGSSGALPPVDAEGVPVAVDSPDAATWEVTTSELTPQVLRLRLSDAAGWHATIDGRPLALEPFAGAMLQARIPAGTHAIELTYWPSTLTLGLVLAGLSVVGLGAGCMAEWNRRKKHTATEANRPTSQSDDLARSPQQMATTS